MQNQIAEVQTMDICIHMHVKAKVLINTLFCDRSDFFYCLIFFEQDKSSLVPLTSWIHTVASATVLPLACACFFCAIPPKCVDFEA